MIPPETLAQTHAAAFTVARPWSAAEFSDLLDSPFVFITGDAAGFAVGRVIADEAELLTIAVDPARRRIGLGRQRLADFETEASRRGAVTAFLEVAEDNFPAFTLYQSANYTVQATRTAYYARNGGNSVNAFIMRKNLTQGQPAKS